MIINFNAPCTHNRSTDMTAELKVYKLLDRLKTINIDSGDGRIIIFHRRN